MSSTPPHTPCHSDGIRRIVRLGHPLGWSPPRTWADSHCLVPGGMATGCLGRIHRSPPATALTEREENKRVPEELEISAKDKTPMVFHSKDVHLTGLTQSHTTGDAGLKPYIML